MTHAIPGNQPVIHAIPVLIYAIPHIPGVCVIPYKTDVLF
jgi:hypothetical protein